MKINLKDSLFAHSSGYVNDHVHPQNFVWSRNGKDSNCPTVVTDLNIPSYFPSSNTFGWMIESPEICKEARNCISRHRQYRSVFTFDRNLLKEGLNYCFCPLGGTFLRPQDIKLQPKKKGLSFVCSSKTSTPQQRNRLDIAKHMHSYGLGDVFGSSVGFTIDNKIDGLKDYAFSVAIENCSEDYYFSEKLIDCFLTGSVPIYWGCPSIGEFFDSKGIMVCNSMSQVVDALKNCTNQEYEKRFPYVVKNYWLALKYHIPENNLLRSLEWII